MKKDKFIFNEEYIEKSHKNFKNSKEWSEFVVPLIDSLSKK